MKKITLKTIILFTGCLGASLLFFALHLNAGQCNRQGCKGGTAIGTSDNYAEFRVTVFTKFDN